jgi:hypothetical protein
MVLAAYVGKVLEAYERDRRREISRRAKFLFLPREAYESLPELHEEQRHGRARIKAWERCREAMLKQLERQRGMRLSYDQTRLLDAMRNTLLLRMYVFDPSFLYESGQEGVHPRLDSRYS